MKQPTLGNNTPEGNNLTPEQTIISLFILQNKFYFPVNAIDEKNIIDSILNIQYGENKSQLNPKKTNNLVENIKTVLQNMTRNGILIEKSINNNKCYLLNRSYFDKKNENPKNDQEEIQEEIRKQVISLLDIIDNYSNGTRH